MMAGNDPQPKPNGLHIGEMFDAAFMVPGKQQSSAGSHGLKRDGMAAGQVPTCEICRAATMSSMDGVPIVHPHSYFYQMMECVGCRWNPPMTGQVVEQYDCSTGNRNSVVYQAAFDKQMGKLLSPTEHAGPVLVPHSGTPSKLTLNRTGLNLKASDLARARVWTRVSVDGPDSLAEANRLLVEMGDQPARKGAADDGRNGVWCERGSHGIKLLLPDHP